MKSRIIGIGQTGSSFFYNVRLEDILADCLLLSTEPKHLTHCWCQSYLIKGNNESSQNNCGALKYADKSAKFIEKLSPIEQLIIVSGIVENNISLIPELVRQARKQNTKIILLLAEPWRATDADREEYQRTLFPYLENYCDEMKVFCYDRRDNDSGQIIKELKLALKNKVLGLLK